MADILDGMDPIGLPPPPDADASGKQRQAPGAARRQAQKRLAPQQILALFDQEKDTLVGRFKKKRAALDSRGVFDHRVNTIRAENMLLTSIGRINLQQLERAQVRKQQGADAGELQGETGRPRRDQGGQSVAARLQAELNELYEKGVTAHQEWERKRKQKVREEKLRRGLPQQQAASPAGKRQGRHGQAHQARQAPQRALTPNMLPQGIRQAARPSQMSSVTSESAAIPRQADVVSEHSSDGGAREDSPEQRARERKQDGDREHGATTPPIRPEARGVLAQQQTQQPEKGSASLPPKKAGKDKPRLQSPASPVQVDFTAAEWMQKHWEHQHYPQVDARARLRRKLADNALRPSDAVARYTERRQWMTDVGGPGGGGRQAPAGGGAGAAAQPALALPRNDSDQHMASPTAPSGAGQASRLVYVCAAPVHSVFHSPRGSSQVVAELRRGEVVAIAEAGNGKPDFGDTVDGTWARLMQPQGWVLLHDTAGAVYLRQVPPEGWARNAATLSVERMLHTPSLLELVDKDLVESAQAARKNQQEAEAAAAASQAKPAEGAAEAAPASAPSPAVQKMPQSPARRQCGEQLRREFTEEARRELEAQRRAVHAELRLHEVTPQQLWPGDSSDDDDLIQAPDDVASRARESDSAAIQAQRETLELLEGVITFLCREYASRRAGRASRSTRVRVVRNLLIQALRALAPHVKRSIETQSEEPVSPTTGQQQAAGQQQTGAEAARNAEPSGEVAVPADHQLLLLRTWTKGVEVLLTWDLELPEPFAFNRQDHRAVLARYYCGLNRRVRLHTERLMECWRRRRLDAEEREAQCHGDERAANGPEERARAEQARRSQEWKSYIAESLIQHAAPRGAVLGDETAARVRGFMERHGYVPSGSEDVQMQPMPPPTGSGGDCPAHQKARAEFHRMFFERFGFVPAGPSGGGGLPAAQGGKHGAASAAAARRIRDILLRDVGLLDGANKDEALKASLRNAAEAGKGGVDRGDLFRGAVLAVRHLYRVCLKHATVPTFAHPSDPSRGIPVRSTGRSLRHGEIVVAVAQCLRGGAEGVEWLRLSGGDWVPTRDPETGAQWLERAAQHDLALWQHSADNAKLASAAGGQAEARRRQRTLLLNDLLSVINKYLKLCSKVSQVSFYEVVQREKKHPSGLDDDARWRRLFDLCSDDSSDDGGGSGAPGAASGRDPERDRRLWEVERDMLLRKYGGQRRRTLQNQRYRELVQDSRLWSLETTGAQPDAEDVALLAGDAEAVQRHRRFSEQRRQKAAERMAAARGTLSQESPIKARTLRRAKKSSETEELDGLPPLPEGAEPPADVAEPDAPADELDSDGERVDVPRSKTARLSAMTKALADLNSIWQNLRVDVQAKIALSDKYARMQNEKTIQDGSDEVPTARCCRAVLRAERLWRAADLAVSRRERAVRNLTQRLDPGLPSYDAAFIDDQRELSDALKQLSVQSADVERAGQRLLAHTGDELAWDGTSAAERLRSDHQNILGLLEQAKAAPAAVAVAQRLRAGRGGAPTSGHAAQSPHDCGS
eukprot:TRINITY_DN14621_c0_g1_i1.p1 TRINITY_DN14621_c0_g1~~TRINITY_DN14621_c0_g1_i1.p1  ORF type:complete len:1536 (+),score=395.09 TRINITY_DN14621_c0_g1_i1:96-4703(+)